MTRTVRRRNCCGFWVDRLTMPDCMPSSLDKPILQKSVFATKCRETSFQHLGSATLPFESPFSDGHEFDHRPCLLKGWATSKCSTNLDPFNVGIAPLHWRIEQASVYRHQPPQRNNGFKANLLQLISEISDIYNRMRLKDCQTKLMIRNPKQQHETNTKQDKGWCSITSMAFYQDNIYIFHNTPFVTTLCPKRQAKFEIQFHKVTILSAILSCLVLKGCLRPNGFPPREASAMAIW